MVYLKYQVFQHQTISDVLEISPSDKEILEINKDKLEKFGYQIDFLSETEVIFRKVPQLISKVSPKEILADILEHISGDIDNIEEQILITNQHQHKMEKKQENF